MQHNQSLQKTKYVLMVEDTASVAALYRSYLTPLDIDINIVGTGRDAIESIGRREPDLILLDLRLPDMTGMDVLYAVKEKSPDVPIVFMTAHGSIDTAVEAMRHGAQDFLIKPCEADRLRVTVNNAIRKASKLKNDVDNKIKTIKALLVAVKPCRRCTAPLTLRRAAKPVFYYRRKWYR